jgi:hypothetical protein
MEPKFKDRAEFVQWFDSVEGKEIAHPAFDVKVNSAIQTYIKKHPDTKDLGPRLDEIEKAIAAKDAELEKETLSHFAYRKCVEAGIDFDLLDGFPLTDEKQIVEKINQLGTKQSKSVDQIINDRLANMQVKPKIGQQRDSSPIKGFNEYALEAEERDRKGRT